MSYNKHELLTLCEHQSSLMAFYWVSVTIFFTFLCCVFVLVVFVLFRVSFVVCLSLVCSRF